MKSWVIGVVLGLFSVTFCLIIYGFLMGISRTGGNIGFIVGAIMIVFVYGLLSWIVGKIYDKISALKQKKVSPGQSPAVN